MESTLCPIGPDVKLIETMGYLPGQGVAHLRLHLNRMGRSAEALGYPFNVVTARAALDHIDGPDPLRVRLTMDRAGEFGLTVAPLDETKLVWTVAIADQRLSASDPWLRHKTTQRALYDTARASLPFGVDEMLFLNERDELCEGTITNLFLKLGAGPLRTPPLTSGVLPGILRHTLIQAEQARAQVLTIDDFHAARQIYVGNALRGLIRAKVLRA